MSTSKSDLINFFNQMAEFAKRANSRYSHLFKYHAACHTFQVLALTQHLGSEEMNPIDAAHFYLIQEYGWLPDQVQKLSAYDLLLVLKGEFGTDGLTDLTQEESEFLQELKEKAGKEIFHL